MGGCIAGKLTPTDKLTKTATAKFVKTKSVQNVIKVLPENSIKEIECKLGEKKTAGAFERAGEETTETLEGFKQNGKAIEVLFMNK